jgi:hypothetical protein
MPSFFENRNRAHNTQDALDNFPQFDARTSTQLSPLSPPELQLVEEMRFQNITQPGEENPNAD